MEPMIKHRVYLCHFLKKGKYLDFCLNELEALADMRGVLPSNLYAEKRPESD